MPIVRLQRRMQGLIGQVASQTPCQQLFRQLTGAVRRMTMLINKRIDLFELGNLQRRTTAGAFGLNLKHPKLTRAIENVVRSEEHTSELQSRPHLVCRL